MSMRLILVACAATRIETFRVGSRPAGRIGALAAKTKKKGFGAAPAKATPAKAPAKAPAAAGRARWAEGPPMYDDALAALGGEGASIVNYLNPREDWEDVGRRLQAGEVVILKDAFKEQFAEAAYAELASNEVPWSVNEHYGESGYAHKHRNVYDPALFSAQLNATYGVFDNDETKAWVAQLTGRDCSGETTGAPSHYRAGDHSLPHTDWVGQRTVAYVWHLSKEWRPEWGGNLYWAQNPHARATYPASFNQLCLFSVTTKSAHFVTTVSPHASQKRLTFNGWWQSSWVPRDDDALDAVLTSASERAKLTHAQVQVLSDLVSDPWQNLGEDRKARVEACLEEARAALGTPPPGDA